MNILYLSNHVSTIVPYLVHKLSFHANDTVTYLGPASGLDSGTAVRNNLFSDCILQKNVGSREFVDIEARSCTFVNAKQDIVEFYDKIIETNGVNLAEFEKIYTANENSCYWIAYLELKHIKYTLLESHPNSARHLVRQEINSPIDATDKQLKRHTLNTPSLYCEKIIYHHLTTETLATWEGDTDVFHYTNCIAGIDSTTANKILESFNVNPENHKGKWSMFLPNGGMYKHVGYTIDNYHWVHQMFVDFYVSSENAVVVKCHPSERASIEELRTMFPYATIWDKNILAELLLLCKGFEMENIYFVVSSSGSVFSNFARNSFKASKIRGRDDWYRTLFCFDIVATYFSVRFLHLNSLMAKKSISCYGISKQNFEFMLETSLEGKLQLEVIDYFDNSEEKTTVALVNHRRTKMPHRAIKMILKTKPTTAIIQNIRDIKEVDNFHKLSKYYKHRVVYRISKKPIRDPDSGVLYEDLDDVFFVVYTNDVQIIRSNRMISDMKTLHNTGVLLTCLNVEFDVMLNPTANEMKVVSGSHRAVKANQKNVRIAIEHVKSELANINAHISSIESSTSWRITRPLRICSKIIGKMVDKIKR